MTGKDKAKNAAQMRKWRAEHPEQARAISRRGQLKWRANHPDEYRESVRRGNANWRRTHPEAARAGVVDWRANNRDKWAGIPEKEMHKQFAVQHPTAVSMDYVRPDFYIPGEGFVEIKRALPKRVHNWTFESVHFPGLWFMRVHGVDRSGNARRPVDEQIRLQPKPVLVIVYHAFTGEELARKIFHQ